MAALLAVSIVAGLLFFCCLVLTALFFGKRHHFSSLEGRHVVITGGSTGIGLAIAKQCLLEGAYVTVMARTQKNLIKARDVLIEDVRCPSNRILIKAVDVSCASAITAAIHESFEWKPIDILVCNAAIGISGFLDEVAMQQLEAQYRINFLGSIYPVHAALPLMKARSHRNPTSIVFINSLCSLFFACGANTYICSKYAQKGLAEMLKRQLEPYCINVQMVIPGFTETAMLDEVDKFTSSNPFWNKIFFFQRERAMTAEKVARITTAAMKRGNFLTTTGLDGFCLRVLGRGLIPEETFVGGMVELAMLLPMRIITTLWVTVVVKLAKRAS